MTYLIGVGINEYSPKIYGNASLQECVNDRDKFVRFIDAPDVILLEDRNATAGNIIGALKEYAKVAKPGDRVYWYQSSHGTYGTPTPRRALPTARCCYDRPLWDHELPAILKLFAKCVEVITISDCCHSGSNTRNLLEGVRAKSVQIDLEEYKPTSASMRSVQCSVINLGACKHFQVAYEKPGVGGFFTAAFIEAATPGKSLKKIMYDAGRGIPAQLGQTPAMEYTNARALINAPFL